MFWSKRKGVSFTADTSNTDKSTASTLGRNERLAERQSNPLSTGRSSFSQHSFGPLDRFNPSVSDNNTGFFSNNTGFPSHNNTGILSDNNTAFSFGLPSPSQSGGFGSFTPYSQNSTLTPFRSFTGLSRTATSYELYPPSSRISQQILQGASAFSHLPISGDLYPPTQISRSQTGRSNFFASDRPSGRFNSKNWLTDPKGTDFTQSPFHILQTNLVEAPEEEEEQSTGAKSWDPFTQEYPSAKDRTVLTLQEQQLLSVFPDCDYFDSTY